TMVQKASVVDLDGFSNYTDEVEGQDDTRAPGQVIQGTKLKFISPRWLEHPTELDVSGKLLTAIGLVKVANKWDLDNNIPVVTRILAPSEKFPDFERLNGETDKSEWREKFGKMVGPWAGQHCLYFVDANLNRFCWPSPTSTIGSAICVRELVDQIKLVRKF